MNLKVILPAAAGLVAVAALGYSLVPSGNAQNQAVAMDKEAIELIVREYLVENPEVIIEALEVYQTREERRVQELAEQALADRLPDLLAAEDGYIAGAPVETAEIAVIEMFDYHCGFCKDAAGYVTALLAEQEDIAMIFRELPILRDESDHAAKIALAARSQGKYVDFHMAMMEASGLLTAQRVDEIAEQVGLDVPNLHASVENTDYQAALDRTREIAIAGRIDGTPAFIVARTDGSFVRIITGWREEAVTEAIAEARAG